MIEMLTIDEALVYDWSETGDPKDVTKHFGYIVDKLRPSFPFQFVWIVDDENEIAPLTERFGEYYCLYGRGNKNYAARWTHWKTQ